MDQEYLLKTDEFHPLLNIAKKFRDLLILDTPHLGCPAAGPGNTVKVWADNLRFFSSREHSQAENANTRISRTALLPLPSITWMEHLSKGYASGGGLPLSVNDLRPYQRKEGGIYANGWLF